jgi:L-rhamnose mutarotase
MALNPIKSILLHLENRIMKFKRYCKTLKLHDDHELIKQYRKAHDIGQVWPEIQLGMKEVGILDMEIYIHCTTLFMIMDTVEDFDHDQAFAELAKKPKQAEWEAYMAQYQVSPADASSDEKWQLMERIFELDQKKAYKPIDGQVKETRS